MLPALAEDSLNAWATILQDNICRPGDLTPPPLLATRTITGIKSQHNQPREVLDLLQEAYVPKEMQGLAKTHQQEPGRYV